MIRAPPRAITAASIPPAPASRHQARGVVVPLSSFFREIVNSPDTGVRHRRWGVRTLFIYVPLAARTCWTAPLARRLDALDLLGLCLAARVEGGPGTRVALAVSGGSGGNVVALGRTAVREAYADAGVPGLALAVLLPSVCARPRRRWRTAAWSRGRDALEVRPHQECKCMQPIWARECCQRRDVIRVFF
ncbi:hypothetical protein B0H14DRAFT_3903782 [Mycena olivaceomarginata]|nr:hypothetical protein B0H14DRAFT_3903782 [Mycena olivaceomarginata]